MHSSPPSPCARSAASADKLSACDSAACACASHCTPTAVTTTWRVLRSNSCSPKEASSAWMLRLNAVCDKWARCAAREKLSSCASQTACWVRRKSIGVFIA